MAYQLKKVKTPDHRFKGVNYTEYTSKKRSAFLKQLSDITFQCN